MKVTVRVDGVDHEARVPYAGAGHVLIDVPCPICRAPAPALIRGLGTDAHDHDSEEAPAMALCCRNMVGRVRVTFSTIFGIEEDRAVLNGRPRVY